MYIQFFNIFNKSLLFLYLSLKNGEKKATVENCCYGKNFIKNYAGVPAAWTTPPTPVTPRHQVETVAHGGVTRASMRASCSA
jgi:hypothetical protein